MSEIIVVRPSTVLKARAMILRLENYKDGSVVNIISIFLKYRRGVWLWGGMIILKKK